MSLITQNQYGKYRWLCLCNCGRETIVLSESLKSGNTKSCGCLCREITRQRSTKHGHKRRNKISKIYISWISMVQRCVNSNRKNYKNYGGRGITVCKRWGKFENFLEDMGEKPEGHQIDRIDNNGNYCKSNCRWTTPKQNSRNRSNHRIINFNGKTQCLSAWAEKFNIRVGTLRARIYKYHWSIEKALTTPVGIDKQC